jgi:hypothetical protein
MSKFHLKKDNVAPTPQTIILFEIDYNIKFPLLRLLQFISDFKSTIFIQ